MPELSVFNSERLHRRRNVMNAKETAALTVCSGGSNQEPGKRFAASSSPIIF